MIRTVSSSSICSRSALRSPSSGSLSGVGRAILGNASSGNVAGELSRPSSAGNKDVQNEIGSAPVVARTLTGGRGRPMSGTLRPTAMTAAVIQIPLSPKRPSEVSSTSDLDIMRTSSKLSETRSPSAKLSLDLSRATAPACRLNREDIGVLLNLISSEERANFEKGWFVNDCRRRFEQLCGDGLDLLQVERIDAPVIFKMFPTLKLDVVLPDRVLPAVTTTDALVALTALFDTDSDGLIDEEEFRELNKFCMAWRSTFYVDIATVSVQFMRTAPLRATGPGRSARRPAPEAPAFPAVSRASSTSRAMEAASSRAAASNDLVSPGRAKPSHHKRASGFGARLHIGHAATIADPRQRRATRADETPRENAGKRPKSTSRGSRASHQSKASSEALEATDADERMLESAENLAPRVDRFRGALYSSNLDMGEFLEFVESSASRRASIEELQGHPLRSYPAPSSKFSGDAVRPLSPAVPPSTADGRRRKSQ